VAKKRCNKQQGNEATMGGGGQEVLKKEGEHQGATSSKVRW